MGLQIASARAPGTTAGVVAECFAHARRQHASVRRRRRLLQGSRRRNRLQFGDVVDCKRRIAAGEAYNNVCADFWHNSGPNVLRKRAGSTHQFGDVADCCKVRSDATDYSSATSQIVVSDAKQPGGLTTAFTRTPGTSADVVAECFALRSSFSRSAPRYARLPVLFHL